MRLRYTRDEAAHLLRERFASSLAHISDAEIEAGARRAERDLPPVIEPLLEMVLVVALRRSGFAHVTAWAPVLRSIRSRGAQAHAALAAS